MIEVAVIGAGAAGLVASRHLLANGLRCCIFEAASTLGGAWSASPASLSGPQPPPDTLNLDDCLTGTRNSKMWNGLHTNLSKHTCRFSDFPWPPDTPTFPSSADMSRYLHEYADEHISPDCFLYNCQVTKITSLSNNLRGDVIGNTNSGDLGYRVEWTDTTSKTFHMKDFGGVIVATGFFSKPFYPPGIKPTVKSSSDSGTATTCQIIHSQDYCSHEDFVDETVAVVGSSFSALEIAVDVSQSARRVVSILPYIPWVTPRIIPAATTKKGGSTSAYLPFDLAFYRRSSPVHTPESTLLTPELCRERHETIHALLGGRQEDVLGIPRDFSVPPMVAISDCYLDLVADGTIEVIHGRLDSVDELTGINIESSSTEIHNERRIVLPDVSKVICGTGFLPDLRPLLDESVLDTLEYDETDMFSPLTLGWETLHPSLPNFAFCGFYRGAYMGVMEQQARLAAKVMSGTLQLTMDQYDEALDVSRKIRAHRPRAQFPRYDYIGLMDNISKVLNEELPKYGAELGDFVQPVFYQHNEDIADACEADIEMELEAGTSGRHIPRIVMSALIGSWKFSRNMVHLANNREEYVHGTIRYSRPQLDYVLYREDGFYQISESKSIEVFREYEYVCNGDLLEVYFVEGGKRAHLFLSLKFQEVNQDGYWVATSDHLCIKDLYKAKFQIKLDGLKATEINISYRVKGPAKDYEATTIMTPFTEMVAKKEMTLQHQQ